VAIIDLTGRDIAIRTAENFRVLRALGITVRKTIERIGGSPA
jgi:hypothetical protein